MGLPQHLEAFLGPIQGGWSRDIDGHPLPFQVVDFARGPRSHTVTFATLGLSKIPLRSRATGKTIYHELIIVLPESMWGGSAPGILQQIGRDAIASGDELLRGDVVGPRGPMFGVASQMEAFYAAIPVYFPDGFATYREEDRDVVMVWLVPITGTEAPLVREYGLDRF